MRRAWVMGLAMTLLGGCGKHETSAPHVTLSLEVRGQNTRDVSSQQFEDGWSVRFDRFWLAPTFGVDDIVDPVKHDGWVRISGQEAYVYGGTALDLADVPSASVFEAWTLAGHSTGWGMRLRPAPGAPAAPESETSLEVMGEATGPEGEMKKLAWRFSTDITFAHCVPPGSTLLPLPEGSASIQATLDGGALFRNHALPEDKLGFARLALADTDDDGTITTAELGAASLDAAEQASEDSAATTLQELLSERLTRLIAPDFACEVATPRLDQRARAADAE
jgi:hypothetical protein